MLYLLLACILLVAKNVVSLKCGSPYNLPSLKPVTGSHSRGTGSFCVVELGSKLKIYICALKTEGQSTKLDKTMYNFE